MAPHIVPMKIAVQLKAGRSRMHSHASRSENVMYHMLGTGLEWQLAAYSASLSYPESPIWPD